MLVSKRVTATSWLPTLAFVTLLLAAALPARAAGDFASRIEGTWKAPVTKEQARKKIDREIDKLVAKMFFFKRPFARGKLKSATQPCARLVFAIGEDQVSIICDDKRPTITEGKDKPHKWVSDDGTEYTITQKLTDDRIVQTFDSGGGVRTNTYRITDDGKLRLDVKVESSQLPEPLTYSRTFEK